MQTVNLTKWRILQPGDDEYTTVSGFFGVRENHIAVNKSDPKHRIVLGRKYRIIDDDNSTKIVNVRVGCL